MSGIIFIYHYFLYGVGETYEVSWLQFHFTGQYQDAGFYFSFTSLIPILIGLFMVGLYESMLKDSSN